MNEIFFMMKDYFMDFGGIPEIPGINNLEPEELEEACMKSAVIGCGAYLVMAVMLLAVLLLSGCTTTREVTVEKVRTDTTYVTKLQTDSIYRHDSVYVKESGGTVYVERWHTSWRDRTRVDTIIKLRTDTVYRYEQTGRERAKQLTWWQRTRMYAGDVMLLALLAGMVYVCIRIKRKFF